MLHQLYNFPHHKPFVLACSGGVDSMAVADFYRRGNKNFELAYFHHGTPQAYEMQKVVEEFGCANRIAINVGYIQSDKPKTESPEEFFRNERYRWLVSLNRDIITCHHLNDVAETWIFSSLHGNPKLIQPCGMLSSYGSNATVYRPFLINTKAVLQEWCLRHNVEWCEDKSNTDTKYPRNFIRHKLLQECLQVNPGLLKTLKKKIIQGVYS